jgi:TDG/mug DNA glycosylase family protein
VADENTRVMIVGSMPGDDSLRQRRYYANPRNQFWRIVYLLFSREVATDYDDRITFLREVRIGLWDVLSHCVRHGSSDSSIRSGAVNDFAALDCACPHLKDLAFNGRKAAATFKEAGIDVPKDVKLVKLPSSSGALARPLDEKVAVWRQILPLLKE